MENYIKLFGPLKDQNIINKFCNDMLLEFKNYVFNPEELKNHIFSDIAFQNIISDSLFLILEKKDTWEKLDETN